MADIPQKVEDSASNATRAGTTFMVPAGWSMDSRQDFVVLNSPENDLKLALSDIDAKSPEKAASEAWAAFDPLFSRPVDVTTPSGPQNGWSDRFRIDYEGSPNEGRIIRAYAWRADRTWLVGLLLSSEAAAEKRRGQLNLVLGSLSPRGYVRESFSGKTAQRIDAAAIRSIKEFLTRGMIELQIPGVAFSLIDQGRIVYEGGLGIRELDASEPIDADTLFIAASNTKALTTLLLAELVDEGKLRWDESVIEAHPQFKLGDEVTTRHMLIKQLVCACTGMPRQDLEWQFQGAQETPAQMMTRLSAMQPTSRLGELYQYSNLMVAAAGFIGGAIAVPNTELGRAFDAAMQRKVLDPLGMTRSTFSFERAMRGNYARPHDVDVDGHLSLGEMTHNYAMIPLRPAGGIWTSAHDLSQYVMMELANGKLPNGRRLVSEQNLLERRKPNVLVSAGVSYGMGLMVDTHWGVTVVHHGGDLAGYHSDMIWLPDYEVGAVLLTNSDTGFALRGPFLRRLVELLFQGIPEAQAQLDAMAAQRKQERVKERERLQVPADAHATGELAALYRNDKLGTLAVTRKDGHTFFSFGIAHAEVASRKNLDASVSFVTITPTLQGVEFVVDQRDRRRVLVLRDAQHEYVFREEFLGDGHE